MAEETECAANHNHKPVSKKKTTSHMHKPTGRCRRRRLQEGATYPVAIDPHAVSK